jgi:hypothetical protein
MSLDVQVVLRRANTPRAVTLMKMHQRRKAKAKDQRPKSQSYKTKTMKSSDVYAASTKKRRTRRET